MWMLLRLRNWLLDRRLLAAAAMFHEGDNRWIDCLMDESKPYIGEQFEREKWLWEQEFRERELLLKERETAVKEGELAIRNKEANRSLVTEPLSFAIIGAVIAGLASIVVSYHSGSEQRALEKLQAEHTRIDHAINGETSLAIAKLQFLSKMGLIKEEPTPAEISSYIDQQPHSPQPGPAQPPIATQAPLAKVGLDSPWLDGGHNQAEVCGGLAGQVRAQNPGKDVKIANMSESNRRDFLGHVTYQYHCQFDVL